MYHSKMTRTYYEKHRDPVTHDVTTCELTYDTEWIRSECMGCDCYIEYDEKRYILRGNYCAECNAFANKRLKMKGMKA